uniref:Pentatricopeptide repeat-containing protein n=1 Tax=Aegilops tauschii TaxID=37682 RepID=M8CEM0_AEGTA
MACACRVRIRLSSSATSPSSRSWSPRAAFAASTERFRAGTLGRPDAHRLFDELLRRDTLVPSCSLNGLLPVLARATSSASCVTDGPALAVALFSRVLRAEAVTCSSVIDALCKAGAMDKAELFLRQMIDNGVRPNKETYNCVINGYSTSGQWKGAAKMFREMTSQGLILDIFTYNWFSSLCKHGRNKEAAEFSIP